MDDWFEAERELGGVSSEATDGSEDDLNPDEAA
jgi:hypothetical protein